MKYYVDVNADKDGDGSKNYPFQKIQQAANIAIAGDEIIVAPGIYRENVDPIYGGKEDKRIIYRSEKNKEAVISGAERICNWKVYTGNVWTTKVSNTLFKESNPFTTLVHGDWFMNSKVIHTGDIYLNTKSMYEVTDLDKVLKPDRNVHSWDADFSIYTWMTFQEEGNTVFYANFQGKNPNDENVEISVRKNCFYPRKEGVGYITVSGFTIRQAATQWAPPTALQEGMIGPHWSKGWIIENCEVYESKCSGISLGKYLQVKNDNKWSKLKYKDGTQTERECICQAQWEGWTKERIGSHIIRECNIHDCGQTGIVGHLGGVFSVIEDNEIHHINYKQNLYGAEIGGIKMHAAIDVCIRRNHVHHCTRGLWLDWQAQGTRITQNLFHDNCIPDNENIVAENVTGEDIFIEISHGPTLVDNNICLSDRAFKLPTQGVAIVHNLITGSLVTVGRGVMNGTVKKASPRYTPYHLPHRTEIAGFMTILHGDIRFYNNIFIQKKIREKLQKLVDDMRYSEWDDNNLQVGTFPYEGYPGLDEYKQQFSEYCGLGSEPSDRYYNPLPVWTDGNIYFNGAKPMTNENAIVDEQHKVTVTLEEKGDYCKIKINLKEVIDVLKVQKMISTQTLGYAFEPEQKFENPDETPIYFQEDFCENQYNGKVLAGPFCEKSILGKVLTLSKMKKIKFQFV